MEGWRGYGEGMEGWMEENVLKRVFLRKSLVTIELRWSKMGSRGATSREKGGKTRTERVNYQNLVYLVYFCLSFWRLIFGDGRSRAIDIMSIGA